MQRFQPLATRDCGTWENLSAGLGSLTRHGQKYEIRGTLCGPFGRVAWMVTIWIVRPDEEILRFVTAFPGERS